MLVRISTLLQNYRFNQLKLKLKNNNKKHPTSTKQMGKLYLMTKTRGFSVESHRCCKVHCVYGYKLIIAKLYTWCLPGLYLYSAPIYLEITQEKYVNLMCLFLLFLHVSLDFGTAPTVCYFLFFILFQLCHLYYEKEWSYIPLNLIST